MIRLAGGAAQVDIAPEVGGALAGFRFANTDVLRPTPTDAIDAGEVRRFACYALVPFSNRIRDGLLVFPDGRQHRLSRNFGDHPHTIHGVGWQRSWTVLRQDATEATLSLDHRAVDADALAWPFPFRATQAFALRVAGRVAMLSMSLAIENTGPIAFPFGLGWHPFFPRVAGARLAFDADGVWQSDATQIPTAWEPLGGDLEQRFRFGAARVLDEVVLDHVYTGWRGRASLALDAVIVEVLADRALDHLVVYVPSQRDFLAVEPVTHMTDAFNRDAARQAGTGTRHLPPGAAWCGTMRIVATLSADP